MKQRDTEFRLSFKRKTVRSLAFLGNMWKSNVGRLEMTDMCQLLRVQKVNFDFFFFFLIPPEVDRISLFRHRSHRKVKVFLGLRIVHGNAFMKVFKVGETSEDF